MVVSMESPVKSAPKVGKKRKRDDTHVNEPKKTKLDENTPVTKKSKNKKVKSAPPVLNKQESPKIASEGVNKVETKDLKDQNAVNIGERFPILNNEELVKKFLSVQMTNNQKGRIRQLLKDSLKGTSEFLLPDVIHNRIQAIIKASNNLSETELRKIRILYNMLKTAIGTEKAANDSLKKKKKKANKKKDKNDKKDVTKTEKDGELPKTDIEKVKKEKDKEHKEGKEKKDDKAGKDKVKGPKRYVVFVGNLPVEIEKEQLLKHFSELNEHIVDVRIPKRAEGKKSSIAYVELKNEPSYELALSKHHSMLGTKRINVLYTTQKNGKVSREEAKSKSAKLIALQKAGKLIGSIPVNRKRSHRRMKMKRAQAKLAAESA